jgi:type II secretory pathway component GspD/PulD (secretin)
VSAPRIVTLPNQPATIRSGEALPDGTSAEVKAEVLVDALGEGTVELEWLESDVVTQRGTIELRSGDATLATYEVLRSPMDLMLKDAKLADVLRLFGQLSGFEVQVPVDLDAKVTVDLHGVPLEDALDEVLEGTGAAWYLDGRTIVITTSR